MRPKHCAMVLVFLGLTAGASAQSITNWYVLAAPSFGVDSCQPVANLHQLETILVPTGWTTASHLPTIDWSKGIVLVTSADQVSKPGASALSQDGSKLLIRLDPTISGQRNSGVFLLTTDGQLGSSKACAVYTVGRPPQPIVTNTNTATNSQSIVTHKTTSTSTRTRPE